MTAVDWLVDTLRKEGVHVPKIYESVAEMREKQQLEKTFKDAFVYGLDWKSEEISFNEYYKETFNK